MTNFKRLSLSALCHRILVSLLSTLCTCLTLNFESNASGPVLSAKQSKHLLQCSRTTVDTTLMIFGSISSRQLITPQSSPSENNDATVKQEPHDTLDPHEWDGPNLAKSERSQSLASETLATESFAYSTDAAIEGGLSLVCQTLQILLTKSIV